MQNKIFYNVLDYGISLKETDNSQKFQELINKVHDNGGGYIYIPTGVYLFDSKQSSYEMTKNMTAICEMKSNVSIIGQSRTDTVLKVIGTTFNGASLFCYCNNISQKNLHSANMINLTIDMTDAYLENYSHRGKAIYYIGVDDCTFKNLRLISTPSTALGIDMLNNVVIDSVYVYEGGRSWTYGSNGGAGIGIGTGLRENENFIIRNCICVKCGHFGIFLEDQGVFHNQKNSSKGQIITNNIIRNSQHYAIGIRGGKYIVVSNNNIYENTGGIYVDYGVEEILISNNLVCDSKEGFGLGDEDLIVNKNTRSCHNIILNNNIFKNSPIIKNKNLNIINENNIIID